MSARSKLLAAGSVVVLTAASSALVAQTAGERVYSGGYATSGIPVTDDAYGDVSQGEPLAPVGVGAAAVAPTQTARSGAIGRGRWTTEVTPYVSGSVSHSDNVNLAPKGSEESETVLTATAGIDISVQSDRLSGQIGYSASYDRFLDNTNEDGLRHSLDTGWTAAIIPNLLHIDVGAGVSEVFVDADDLFSGNPVANADNRSRAYYGLVSPSLRKNLGGWANAELRYTLRGEAYDGDIDGGHSHTYSASLSSDPRKFRRLGWVAATEFEDYNAESSDEELQRWTSYVSVDVPVSRTLAVTGSAGIDHFSENVNSDFEGVYGNVGLRYQPSQRLSSQVFAGYRYGGADYGASLNYAARRNLNIALAARRGLQFSNYDDNEALRTALNGEEGGLYENLTPSFAIQQASDAIVDTLSANVTGAVGKTGWTAGVTAVHRDFDQLFDDETVVSANLGVTRALTNRLGAELGAGYSHFSQDDGTGANDFATLALGAGLTFQLTEIVNVFGRYTYTERFADDSLDEFKENAGVVGVTASF